MPETTDINLPRSQMPVFPDRCVCCAQEKPGNTVRVCTNAIGWWTVVLLSFGSRFCVEVPACESCRRWMQHQRWFRLAITWGLAIAGVAIAVHVLGEFRFPWRHWLAASIALACMVPWIFWQTFYPPPIDLTAYSNSVDYEFRDVEYGREFARLNKDATNRTRD